MHLAVAAQGLVLLANPAAPATRTAALGANVLPMSAGKRTAVIGPHGNSTGDLLGNYFDMACANGSSTQHDNDKGWPCVASPLAAIAAIAGKDATTFAPGCADMPCARGLQNLLGYRNTIKAAVKVAAAAEQIVLCVGLNRHEEKEGRDRANTSLPGLQSKLAIDVLAVAKRAQIPLVIVLINGGTVSLSSSVVDDSYAAVVEAWYPGLRGGNAPADALFGATNRWGKLPVTIYQTSYADEVPMLEMSFTKGKGRGYRFWHGDAPLIEFSAGLSYTTFAMAWKSGGDDDGASPSLQLAPVPPPTWRVTELSDTTTLRIDVRNTGAMDGDEVVFVFHVPHSPASGSSAALPLPKRRLVAFQRAAVAAGSSGGGKTQVVAIALNATTALNLVDENGDAYLYPGTHSLVVTRGSSYAEEIVVSVVVACAAPLLIEALF